MTKFLILTVAVVFCLLIAAAYFLPAASIGYLCGAFGSVAIALTRMKPNDPPPPTPRGKKRGTG